MTVPQPYSRELPSKTAFTYLPSKRMKEFFVPVPELATRSDVIQSFVVRQNESSKAIVQSSGAVFFNIDTMLQGPEFPISRLKEHVEKFAAEHFFKATKRLAYFDGENWYHPDGESYTDFFDRAIVYYANDPHLVERFIAEKQGYINAGLLVQQQLSAGEESPVWAIASAPGDVYRNQSFATRNVTFISMPICDRLMRLGEGPEKTYHEYEMYVVPSAELATHEHWQAIVDAAKVEDSLSTLGLAVEMVRSGDANFVVETPLLLEDVIEKTDLALKLGYTDFAEIVHEAENMLALEQDPLAITRRQDMINYFTEEMWQYISRRDTLSDQERLKLQGLADVMHDYLSAEAGLEYVGKTFAEIQHMIEGHTMIQYRNMGVTFSTQELAYIDWDYAEMVHAHYFSRLELNLLTQERRNATGCVFVMNREQLNNPYDPSTMTSSSANVYEQPTTTEASADLGQRECYQCPMSGCGADVYTKNGDTYCLKGHHKGG